MRLPTAILFGFCSLAFQASPAEVALMSPSAQEILDEHCLKCHGPVKTKGGVDLRGLSQILSGGDSGPILEPGSPDESRLIQVLRPDADPHMPPKAQLSEEAIRTLRQWALDLPALLAEHKEGFSDRSSAASAPVLELPPDGANPTAMIDERIRLGYARFNARPSPLIDDAHFLRRVTLDLAGRLPSPQERRAFLTDPTPIGRERVVDRLLNSPEYAQRMTEVFDVFLMGRADERQRPRRDEAGWRAYLKDAFARNRPWNEIVRELILARPENRETQGSVWFLYERGDDHQAMAEAVAPIAFGSQIDCAQCHDHPLASEIEQAHYWGLVSAFNRSTNTRTPEGFGLDESAVGGFVKFANLQKETQPAVLKFLNGVTVPEARPEGEEEDSPELYDVPPAAEGAPKNHVAVPKFSRRRALAEAASQNNPLLARAMVNRLWGLLMGRGLVHPVDEINSRHPASHPTLLAWLARDYELSGYDTRRLVRSIVLSRTYRLGPPQSDAPRSAPESFAHAIERPLTAEDLYRSYAVALTGRAPNEIVHESLSSLRNALLGVFPEVMPEVYNATMPQAMFLSNAPQFQQALRDVGQAYLDELSQSDSLSVVVDDLYRRVFMRAPDAEEREAIQTYLAEPNSNRADRLANLLWATLTSAEFQLNY